MALAFAMLDWKECAAVERVPGWLQLHVLPTVRSSGENGA